MTISLIKERIIYFINNECPTILYGIIFLLKIVFIFDEFKERVSINLVIEITILRINNKP